MPPGSPARAAADLACRIRCPGERRSSAIRSFCAASALSGPELLQPHEAKPFGASYRACVLYGNGRVSDAGSARLSPELKVRVLKRQKAPSANAAVIKPPSKESDAATGTSTDLQDYMMV